MAQAIIQGAIKSGIFKESEIVANDTNKEKLFAFAKTSGIKAETNLVQTVNSSEIIVLSIKPQIFPDVLPLIKPYIAGTGKLIISIAAGKTIKYIADFLGESTKIIRVMPNLNATVLEAMSAYCFSSTVTENDRRTAETLFNSVGKTISVPEEDFSAFSAVSGCSPAFVFMFINALSKAGEKFGLNPSQALNCAVQAVKGSAVQLENSSENPQELINRVCSPGGTTIEGVKSLDRENFYGIIEHAVKASYEKDKIL